MATKSGKGPGAAYQRSGLGGVWKYVKGHGLKRWLKAKHWAERRAKLAGPNKAAFKKAEAVYAKKVAYLKAHKHPKPPQGDQVVFDGRTCPGWIVRKALIPARASGIWTGTCISGVRTVAESIALCQGICGQDSCPGTCAGAATNHTCPPTHTCAEPEGAVDCLDPAGLEAFCRSHGVPLYGDGYVLPSDVNHFSARGN